MLYTAINDGVVKLTVQMKNGIKALKSALALLTPWKSAAIIINSK